MSFGDRLLEPIRSGSLHINWQFEDVNVDVEIEVSDRLSMLVRRICALGTKRDATPLLLKKQAQAVIDRLTYLDSSLRLIEWDQISNMVQVRGRPDRAEGTSPQYFEIIIDRSPSILLHRRSGHEAIPFHISNDCFVPLIDDLVRIVRLQQSTNWQLTCGFAEHENIDGNRWFFIRDGSSYHGGPPANAKG